jgi:FKBP-type peptidyl-prolyl cis-trans isomerase (trigger factor)
MKVKKEKRKNAEVVLSGALPKEAIEKHTEKTLNRIAKEIELQGFRKGKAPVEKVREYVGEKTLWKEAAEMALREELENILKENEVLPLVPVSASLSSSEAGADMPFEIFATVAPTCSISGFKETAAKALKKLEPLNMEKEKAQALDALHAQTRQMVQAVGEGPLGDDEAKKLGFENGAALNHFVEDEAERAVKERDLQKKRSAVAEALIEKAECDLPHVLIRQEASALLEATKKDYARQGLPFNEYLKHVGKSENDVLKDLEVPAEKRVCLDLVFAEIAREEKITADEKEEERLAHALVQQGVDHEGAHRYVRATVMREKVWELLGTPAVSKQPAEPAEKNEENQNLAG